MRKRFASFAMFALCALVSVISYRVGRAHADGAPSVAPLTYSGVLDDGGTPVNGMRSVTVRLWDMATGGAAVCTTVSPTTPVAAGRFRVTMDPACATAVQANPNLWAEVIVDATTFARSKVGAVPYALEAGRAAGASGPLATRIAAVETQASAAAIPRQVVIGDLISPRPFCTSPTVSSSVQPLTIMARASSLYRILIAVAFSGGVSGGARISCPAATFVAQPPAEIGVSTTYVPSMLTAVARLEAGHSYTFVVETCTTSMTAASPLIVEQLN